MGGLYTLSDFCSWAPEIIALQLPEESALSTLRGFWWLFCRRKTLSYKTFQKDSNLLYFKFYYETLQFNKHKAIADVSTSWLLRLVLLNDNFVV